jgi:hypothetical protein
VGDSAPLRTHYGGMSSLSPTGMTP